MPVTRVSNRSMRTFVQAQKDFVASNVYAEHRGDTYVVFSYGEHFPMFIHKDGLWYENSDGYSRTTARQKGQARPADNCTKLDTAAMKALLYARRAA